jgi:hypothetical protein
MLIELSAEDCTGILVKPRWPYHRVFVSSAAYERLKEAQSGLDLFGISLVLTRGLENEGAVFRLLHKVGRWVGACIFCFLFPSRCSEARDIFGSNGHDASPNCIDVGIVVAGQPITLLPRGLFTSKTRMEHAYLAHRDVVEKVFAALRTCGFCIHTNRTEALQIHCELGGALGQWQHGA